MKLLRISLIALLASCSTQEEKKSTAPPQPIVDKAPKPKFEASFASVQMLDDCPDPPSGSPGAAAVPSSEVAPAPPAPPPKPATPAKPTEIAPQKMPAPSRSHTAPADAPAGYYKPPCQQSTIQLSLRNLGSSPAKAQVSALRLLSKDGAELASLQSRSPTKWQDGGYLAWNGEVPGDAELKASYKISSPDWNAVQTAIGGSSYGPMYVLEADIVVGTDSQTIRSAEFTRQRPLVPPT